jgi:hypothetical protein
MVAEPSIRSAMRILFYLVLWAQSFVAVGQNLWIEMLQASNEIGEESLNPPQTAGADYSNEIVLESQAVVNVTEISPRTPWCLKAQESHVDADLADIILRPDPLNTVSGHGNTIVLSSFPQPVYSGEGPAEGLLIEFLLVGAKLDRDWEAREINIEWTVVYGECLL